MPRSTKRPTLTRETVAVSEVVDTFIAAVLGTVRLRRITDRVRRRQDHLRDQLTDREWRTYLLLEEEINVRVVEESRVIARAAFEAGLAAAKRPRGRP